MAEEPIAPYADVEPEFPGGDDALMQFIHTNFIYPDSSIANGESGTVYVQFVVNQDGSVSDIKILKSVSPLLDAEAIRVISIMPRWTPGQLNGK